MLVLWSKQDEVLVGLTLRALTPNDGDAK
jgi:hypothetical protein